MQIENHDVLELAPVRKNMKKILISHTHGDMAIFD